MFRYKESISALELNTRMAKDLVVALGASLKGEDLLQILDLYPPTQMSDVILIATPGMLLCIIQMFLVSSDQAAD